MSENEESTKKEKGMKKKPIKKPKRIFPRVTLQKALEVPKKIKELNGGNPWEPEQLAEVFDLGVKANNLYYLTAASRDYGLTKGTSRADSISIEELGSQILFAPDPETENQRKVEAFLRIPIFKSVLEHYNGSDLPEMKYLGNTLEKQFGIPPEFHEEFSKLFRENCDYLGLSEGVTEHSEISTDTENEKPLTVVVGESKAKGKSKLKAFVIMPFTEKNPERPKGFFKEVLRSLITPAGVEAGFQVETANRQGSDIIQSTIINDLLDADLVIADLTDHNPNVLFELGLRMAEDKPVALIKASGTGAIFDVDNMLRVESYNANLWRSTIETDLPELTEHIKAAWEQRESKQSYIRILRRQ
ncbi:MAG: hypothetical protein N0C88_21725 [Candidatus Thiodiazotropha lotti]|uniref:Nucleoside 2-deoxyribosyltransferase n=1 Tax=Candidatus Thiodiazotropha lotti TaxID=2792787 RepID=A0A9E4N1W8_9GAMM|nr:hypothetical protein [Candidatus Thiodiazotropha lotti]MCW4205925.1 hypothetical protein [Candidatus Thiodiazotropha lotti]